MVNIDRKTQLGLILMLLLSGKKNNELHSASKLASELCISESYLHQISKHLCRYGLLKGFRGPHGGYALTTSAGNISIGDVIRAMQKHKPDSNKSYSRENIIWDTLCTGLFDYLNTQTIKSLTSNKQRVSKQELTQNNKYSFMQKLII